MVVVLLTPKFVRSGVVRRAGEHPRVEVMGLDASGLLAAVPVRGGVLAAPFVPLPEDPQHSRGGPPRARMPRPTRPWLVRPGPLLSFELVEQHGERPVEHGVVVARRDHVAEEVLCPPQLRERL